MKVALICFGNEESYGLLFVGGELLLFNQEIRYFDAEKENVIEEVTEWLPDYAFFSPMTAFFAPAMKVIKELKSRNPNIVSVFGGHHATSNPKIIEKDDVDVVVVGPVRGSIDKILAGQRGVIIINPTTPDDMPMPARKEYYRDIPRMANRYRKVMLSMFGCPWNCSYCSSSSSHLIDIYGSEAHKRFFLSRRPVSVIIDEAKEILRLGKTAEMEWGDDDIFTGANMETWLPEFVDLWEAEIGLPLYVQTTSRYALKASDNALASLKRIVNCVGMGVQAFRPESLKLFNRGWDNEEQMKKAYDRLTSFGFSVNLQAIVGLPIEDPVGDAIDTVKCLKRIGPGSICSVYPLIIFPGTILEKYCKDSNIALNDSCSMDTNTGISNISFPPEVTRKIRNISKLATFFVKYNVDERWMLPLIDIDYDETTSHAFSMGKYYECVIDRLKSKGEDIFNEIQNSMNLRY